MLQTPFLFCFRECEDAFHSLKSPAMDTLRARGADKENSAFRPTDFFLNIAAILNLLFVLACLFQLNHPSLPHGLSSTEMV